MKYQVLISRKGNIELLVQILSLHDNHRVYCPNIKFAQQMLRFCGKSRDIRIFSQQIHIGLSGENVIQNKIFSGEGPLYSVMERNYKFV